jgi:hypothetical protein
VEGAAGGAGRRIRRHPQVLRRQGRAVLNLPAAETLLLPGIAAFYLYDSALLLYADEVVFARPLRRWRAALGEGATWQGRFLAFPALSAPGAPVFRAVWSEGGRTARAPATERVLGVLRPLRWAAWLVAFALFALVPLALLLHASQGWLLGLLALIYLPTLLAVAHLARYRAALGLAWGELAAIAFDVLACPPFALNLVRRVTLRCGLAQPATTFADAVLDAASRARLGRALEARRALLADDGGAEDSA